MDVPIGKLDSQGAFLHKRSEIGFKHTGHVGALTAQMRRVLDPLSRATSRYIRLSFLQMQHSEKTATFQPYDAVCSMLIFELVRVALESRRPAKIQ